jgi:drug/metabolite transporter (DMT)-like permease
MIDILVAFGLLSSAIIANKILLYTLSPQLLVAIRMITAGAILLVSTIYSSRQPLSWCRFKQTFFQVIFIALCATSLSSMLKAYSLSAMTSAKAAFYGTLDPFISSFYAYIFFHERLTLRNVIGMIIACSGIALLTISRAPTSEIKAFLFVSYPELSAILAVAISRLGWILVQRLLKKDIYTPVQINAQIMIYGGFFALITALVTDSMSITIDNINKVSFIGTYMPGYPTLMFVCALLYTIVIGNILSYNFYAATLKKYSATLVALLGFSVPLFVGFYGWLLLGETLSIWFFVSFIITFLGLVIFKKGS